MSKSKDKERIVEMFEAFINVAGGDYSIQIDLSGKNDALDSLAMGFNMMIDDIRSRSEEIEIQREYTSSIFKSMTDALFVVSPKGTIETVNSAACNLLGYKERDLVGRPVSILFSPGEGEAREGEAWLIEGALKEKRISNVEKTFITKDKREIPVLISASAMSSDTREIRGIVCVAKDITALKQATRAVEVAAKQWENTFDSISDAMVILDTERHILKANKTARDMFAGEGDIIGMKCFELFHGTRSPAGDCQTCLTFETAEAVHSERFEEHLGGRWFDYTSHAIRTVDGHIDQIVHIVRDVTERKRITDALSKEKDFVSNLIDTAQTIILVLDTEGKIVRFNPYLEEISGYRLEDVLGDSWFSTFLPKQDSNKMRDLFKTAISGIQTKGNINPIVSKDGKEIVVEWYDKTLEDADGNIVGLLAVGQDITRRVKAEEERRAAFEGLQKSQAELAALLGSTQVVLESRRFEETARSIFDTCKNMLGARGGYVALLSSDGTENEVLFLDTGEKDCKVDPELPMPVRGLRAKAYKTGKVVCENDFQHAEWRELLPPGHATLKNVLFAPLKIEGGTVGIMGFANKDGEFTKEDVSLAQAFSELVAIALHSTRNLDALQKSEEKYRLLIEKARDAIFILEAEGPNAGKILTANQAAADMHGYSVKELLELNISDLDIPSSRKAVPRRIQSLLKGEWLREEALHLKKNGEVFPIEISSGLVEIDNRKCFLAFDRDITDRKRLEKEILEISDREKQRIGHDLHDGVCQHLSGVALMTKLLQERVAAKSLPVADDAGVIIELVERAIDQVYGLSKGLLPVSPEPEGIVIALKELAVNVSDMFTISCQCACDKGITISDHIVATHLYRIAQESVHNAIKHGNAKEVTVKLSEEDGSITLSVKSNGLDFPELAESATGMGLHIMGYRAQEIGGVLDIGLNPGGGTLVTCSIRMTENEETTHGSEKAT